MQTVMKDKGIAHIGIGHGKGDDKASEAVKMAVESPLLETTIAGATDVIINVSGDISMYDADDAASYVQQLTGDDVNIIFGAMYDDTTPDTCTITVIATGLEDRALNQQQSGRIASSFSVKPSIGGVKQVQPNVAARNYHPTQGSASMQQRPAAQQPRPSVQQPSQGLNGIRRPGNLRSNVEEKTLKIPDFLQKK